MATAFVEGFRIAVRRWPIVLVLFLASLASGLSFTAAAWSWLSLALDRSLASRTLLTDLDLNVFVDLYVHHGESLRVLVITGSALALAFGLLGVGLNAVAVVAVREEVGWPDCLRQAVGLSARYLRLGGLVYLCIAASVVVVVFSVRTVERWVTESPSEMTYYWVMFVGLVVVALLSLFFVTVHDHARIYSAATGAGAARAFAWAVAFVSRGELRALPLSALLLLIGLLAWAVYQTLGTFVGAGTPLGLVVSLVWGQTLLLLRMVLRVWSLAAAAELQHLRDWT